MTNTKVGKMKPKNVIVWILLLGIVVLLMSTSAQAKEHKEVNATYILEKIEKGENISLEDARITGELNLSKIELITLPIARSKQEIMYCGLEEELKIVESNIIIRDSVFERDVDFSNTEFRKDIEFFGTSFSSRNFFRGANFAGDANFEDANFTGNADFQNTNFTGNAYFRDANFAGNANFEDANFAGDADFYHANFAGNAGFWYANFAGFANFNHANFAGDSVFWYTIFAGFANFNHANFAGDADFENANFAGFANFEDANFAGFANFNHANFAGFANFNHANFAGNSDFYHANFAGNSVFWYTNFRGNAYFTDTNFRGNATFFSTEFDEVSFIWTTFTNVSLNETDYNKMNVEWSTLKDALVFDGATYIKLIKNFREIEQFEEADDATYKYRRLSQANKKWSGSKLKDVVAWASCGYGVKPEYPLIWSFILIMIFTLVYWRGKGIKRLKENDGDKSRVPRWAAFYNAFYFSVVTFTTVGYGDWYPEDRYRIVVMIEGVLGWLLLALFIVTLANVMIRP